MSGGEIRRLAVLLHAEGAEHAPPEIPLIPAPDAGGTVVGRDGRAFRPDLDAIRDAFQRDADAGRFLCVDWEHATEGAWSTDPRHGGRAAGWIESLRVDERGTLIGRVTWTPDGAADVVARAYRYISPAVFVRSSGGGEDLAATAVALSSAALTNRPNLTMPAVHREDPTMSNVTRSLLLTATIAALALPPDTTEEQAAERITAHAAAGPDPERFAPIADLTAAKSLAADLHRLDTAARDVLGLDADAAIDKVIAELHALRDARVADKLNAAVAAGKIAPAAVESYREIARSNPAGFDRLMEATPAVFKRQGSDAPPAKPPGKAAAHNYTDTDLRIARAAGVKLPGMDASG